MRLVFVAIVLIITSCSSNEVEPLYSYEDGLSIAKEHEKDVLLIFDFWGNPTSSTQRMLEDHNVRKLLEDKVVIILMVDEEGEQGDINSRIQREHYNAYVQPQYYLLDHDGKVVKGPKEYCDLKEFIEFVE